MPKKQIMVVEDDGIVARDIETTLENLGFGVSGSAVSGEKALKMIKTAPPDLVLMDIMLKGEMDGIETTEQIRAMLDVPVVYVSAHTDEKIFQRAKLTEPFGYVIKPFDDRELQVAVEIALYKHKMERKLKEREEWLSTTLKGIGDGVIAADNTGRITFMNPVAESLTGWRQGDAIGRPCNEVFHIIDEQTRKRCENPVEKVLNTGKIVGFANSTVLIAKNGTERIIADSGAPILGTDEKTAGVVLVFQDITERLRLETKVQQARKLESIGTLTGGLAHDFNNILGVITGNVSYALSCSKENEALSTALMDVQNGARQAQNLTQQLLTFAKGGAPIKKPADLNMIVKESEKIALGGSKATCVFNLSDELWMADVDKGQIVRVFSNLMINASQAMPGGGLIRIRTKNTEAGSENTLYLRPGRYIKITIEDQGVGISKEHLSRIFDPYFSTKQKGSGLGLAITYSIIKRHHGHIAVFSKPDEGSVFDIYLPASSAGSADAGGDNKKDHRGEGKILVMDDQKAVLEMFGRILTRMGYETVFATDGGQAVDMYREAFQSGKPFDLVILDLTVPGGKGGAEAISELLKINPGIKAVVSSGYSNDPIMASYEDHGFCGVIPKPFTITQLADTLNMVSKCN